MLQMQEHLTKETKWRQNRHTQEQMGKKQKRKKKEKRKSNEQKSPRIQESH